MSRVTKKSTPVTKEDHEQMNAELRASMSQFYTKAKTGSSNEELLDSFVVVLKNFDEYNKAAHERMASACLDEALACGKIGALLGASTVSLVILCMVEMVANGDIMIAATYLLGATVLMLFGSRHATETSATLRKSIEYLGSCSINSKLLLGMVEVMSRRTSTYYLGMNNNDDSE